jgi:hypothetical protein
MIYTSQDNWYKWSYGDTLWGRQVGNLKWNTSYKCTNVQHVGSFKEEMLAAARSTMDHFSGLKPCVHFSGGLDSELVLRSYINIGADPIVNIFRFEDHINEYDVSYAIVICEILDVKYNIIDFNIKKFFENDAESISDISQIDRPRGLPQLKFLDYTEGFSVLGIGDPRWTRSVKDNTPWILLDQEHDTGWDKYILYKDIPAIAQWFKWTPELVLAYTELDWFKNLVINNKWTGREGVTSTKITGYREAYPDLLQRDKKTGMEPVDILINEFEKFLEKKNNGLIYRQVVPRTLEELRKEILND